MSHEDFADHIIFLLALGVLVYVIAQGIAA
jgi:hypothetical protein